MDEMGQHIVRETVVSDLSSRQDARRGYLKRKDE